MRPRLPLVHVVLPAAVLAAALAGGGLLLAADEPVAGNGPFRTLRVIDFEGEIEAVQQAYVVRRVNEAVAEGVEAIVLRIDSLGGAIYHSKKLGDALLAVPDHVHVVAWVPEKAISGGAFVALACDELIMTASASIGDSQPITRGQDGRPEPIGEKIESPLRTWFRAYAEANGYPVLLAEAMVSAHVEVIRVRAVTDGTLHFVRGEDWRRADDASEVLPGHRRSELEQVGPTVVRKGELLTITGRQAADYGFIARTFEGGLPRDEAAMLAAIAAPDADITYTAMTFSERASKWLLGVAGVLAAIVGLSIMLFLFQGPGLMTIVGGVALVLSLLINATADQVHGFPLFLVLVGMVLLAAEVFLIPGFGVAGILGMTALGAGFLFLASGASLEGTGALDGGALLDFALQFVATVIVGLGLLILMSRFVPRVGPARRMVLQAAGGPAEAADPTAPAASDLPSPGTLGRTRSALRPAGTAEFDGLLVDVVGDGRFIEPGTPVVVVRVEGYLVTVRPAPGHHAPERQAPESQAPEDHA